MNIIIKSIAFSLYLESKNHLKYKTIFIFIIYILHIINLKLYNYSI